MKKDSTQMASTPQGFLQTALALALAATAQADIVFDHIGPDDGSSLDDGYVVSQHFDNPQWDIAAITAFSLEAETVLSGLDFVLTGNANFQGPDVIADYEINVYSDLESASSNLIGDILSTNLSVVLDPDWTGPGTLLNATLGHTLDAGSYMLSVMMTLTSEGQANPGIATTTLSSTSWMTSPGDKYPWSPAMELNSGLAYRLHGNPVPAPGALALLACAVIVTDPRRRRR